MATLVVDVLVTYEHPDYLIIDDPKHWLAYVAFNGLAFEAADGGGFSIEDGDGQPIRLRSFDIASPPSESERARYRLQPELTVPIGWFFRDDKRYLMGILPVLVNCERDVPVGTCVRVRFNLTGRSHYDVRRRSKDTLTTTVNPIVD